MMKLICIREWEDFKVGEIYYSCGKSTTFYDRYDIEEYYSFYTGELDKYYGEPITIEVYADFFVTPAEHREKQIDSILDEKE